MIYINAIFPTVISIIICSFSYTVLPNAFAGIRKKPIRLSTVVIVCSLLTVFVFLVYRIVFRSLLHVSLDMMKYALVWGIAGFSSCLSILTKRGLVIQNRKETDIVYPNDAAVPESEDTLLMTDRNGNLVLVPASKAAEFESSNSLPKKR